MPTLQFNGKYQPEPQAASLLREATIYPQGNGYPDVQHENRLLLGDNLPIMAALVPEYKGKINLIYADPPFFTNRKFSARIGRGEDSRKPREWNLAEGYHDHWDDLDSYLSFLFARLQLMHQLLSPTGTLYLHLDWHADAYARLLLDEIFGADNFLNEIIWSYHGPSPIRSAFNRKHDTILVYTKSKNYTFNADAVRIPYDDSTVKTFAASPKAGFGKIPDLKRGKVPEDWWYFPVVARLHNERTGYPTQKPEALLERIILASSNPGDLVADFFCGSGTTPLVASKHERHFIASDATWRAIHTTRSRLAAGKSPFSIERSTAIPWNVDEFTSRIQISAADGQVRLSGDIKNINYWEVDPQWNGEIFQSAAQSIRPVRVGELKTSLELPQKNTGGKYCLRAVTDSGQHLQTELKN